MAHCISSKYIETEEFRSDSIALSSEPKNLTYEISRNRPAEEAVKNRSILACFTLCTFQLFSTWLSMNPLVGSGTYLRQNVCPCNCMAGSWQLCGSWKFNYKKLHLGIIVIKSSSKSFWKETNPTSLCWRHFATCCIVLSFHQLDLNFN